VKLDSSKGHLWTAQHVAGRELLSVDPTRRAIELDFINRLLARLNVAPARPPAERLRAIVDALDSGELDGAVQPLGSWSVAVELVVEGGRGGQRAALSTASPPVRRRRIVHKSTACLPVWRCSSTRTCDGLVLDHVAEHRAQRQSLIGSPNGCLGAGGFGRLQLACSTRMGV
jgi:hypothetical protein